VGLVGWKISHWFHHPSGRKKGVCLSTHIVLFGCRLILPGWWTSGFNPRPCAQKSGAVPSRLVVTSRHESYLPSRRAAPRGGAALGAGVARTWRDIDCKARTFHVMKSEISPYGAG
jgi:hypothetical protein